MIDLDNNKKVTFTGKEYLEYCKYKDARRDKKAIKLNKGADKTLKFLYKYRLSFGALFVGLVAIATFISVNTPKTEPYSFTLEWFLGFLAVCLGLSWIIHGVGFVLVKR